MNSRTEIIFTASVRVHLISFVVHRAASLSEVRNAQKWPVLPRYGRPPGNGCRLDMFSDLFSVFAFFKGPFLAISARPPAPLKICLK